MEVISKSSLLNGYQPNFPWLLFEDFWSRFLTLSSYWSALSGACWSHFQFCTWVPEVTVGTSPSSPNKMENSSDPKKRRHCSQVVVSEGEILRSVLVRGPAGNHQHKMLIEAFNCFLHITWYPPSCLPPACPGYIICLTVSCHLVPCLMSDLPWAPVTPDPLLPIVGFYGGI